MRHAYSLSIVLLFMCAGPAVWAGGRGHQPDRGQRPSCQHELRPTEFDFQGEDIENPGYMNSFEENWAGSLPGPDEVDVRNPEDHDARDPGEF